MHEKQATVYAYRSELDAWLRAREAPAQPEVEAEPSASRRFPPAWAIPLLGVLAVGALLWLAGLPHNEAIAFGERDWVLITDFDNRTGEELLDGTLEYALQRELSNSSLVKVAPRDRLGDALRLMKLPPDTPLDLAIGREISLRDGGIRLLVSGRIEKLGPKYLLSAELVQPSDGFVLASFSEGADEQDALLKGVERLARDVRRSLGDGLQAVEDPDGRLAPVATRSLEALKLYTEAERMMRGPERLRAISVLEEAVRLDPEFASAHLLLAYTLQDADRIANADEHLIAAFEHAEAASDQERLFIRATHQLYYLNDYAASVETYRLLCRLYPGHPWASGNLGRILEWQGRHSDALVYKRLNTETHPNRTGAHWEAVRSALAAGDEAARDHHLARLEALPEVEYWIATNLPVLPMQEAWIRGDLEAVSKGVEAAVAARPTEALLADGLGFARLRSFLLALGRLERQRELAGLRPGVGWFEALSDFDAGRPATLERYLASTQPTFWNATLAALAGDGERARRWIEDPRSIEALPVAFLLRNQRNLALGQLALEEGRFQEAIPLLGDDAYLLSIPDKGLYLFAMHSLARAHAALGELDSAISVLEQASTQRDLTIFGAGDTWMWLRCQHLLQQLHDEAGQVREAELVRQELRDRLRLADPGHPFLPDER
jgi:tetratricopeptide (TPR) repeat protein